MSTPATRTSYLTADDGGTSNPSTNIVVNIDQREAATATVTTLLAAPQDLDADRDPEINGGRTVVDLTWDLHDGAAAGNTYRIEFSLNPAEGGWMRVDGDGTAGDPVGDYAITADEVTAGEATFAHTGRDAGVRYYYRIYADQTDTNVADKRV